MSKCSQLHYLIKECCVQMFLYFEESESDNIIIEQACRLKDILHTNPPIPFDRSQKGTISPSKTNPIKLP